MVIEGGDTCGRGVNDKSRDSSLIWYPRVNDNNLLPRNETYPDRCFRMTATSSHRLIRHPPRLSSFNVFQRSSIWYSSSSNERVDIVRLASRCNTRRLGRNGIRNTTSFIVVEQSERWSSLILLRVPNRCLVSSGRLFDSASNREWLLTQTINKRLLACTDIT